MSQKPPSQRQNRSPFRRPCCLCGRAIMTLPELRVQGGQAWHARCLERSGVAAEPNEPRCRRCGKSLARCVRIARDGGECYHTSCLAYLRAQQVARDVRAALTDASGVESPGRIRVYRMRELRGRAGGADG